MFEKHKIIVKFKGDVAEHLAIILDEIRKRNFKEAILWLNELLNMKKTWIDVMDQPVRIIGSFASGLAKDVEQSKAQELASLRVAILDEAINSAKTALQQAGFK